MGATIPSGIVRAVCVGRASVLTPEGRRPVRTAFVKSPVEGPVLLGRLGFPGDEHVYADHGGPDMAALVYSHDHYAYWRELGLDLPDAGAMGENLTVTGMRETDVHLGDVLVMGGAVVQVCQPRSPCAKLAARYGRRDMAVLLQDSGRTGYLLRVLEEGPVAAGDAIALVERGSDVSVAEAGRILDVDRADLEGARHVLEVDALGSSTRAVLERRLRSTPQTGLDTARLFDEPEPDA